MKKVYICSPYTGDTKKNIEIAIAYSKLAIRGGYMPIASHLIYPQMLNDEKPEERELGLKFGIEMVEMCDEIWIVITKAGVTAGMEDEIVVANKNHIPCKFFKFI